VIELAFDPVVRVGDASVRLDTIALAIVALVGILLAARIAGRTPVDPFHAPDDIDPETHEANHLRRDDLLYLVVAALPGAVVGGRLGYVLLHPGFFATRPESIVDPAQGSLQLSLGLLGGTLTAALLARLLGAPVGRWLHAATLPTLFVLGAGKAALVLGGTGQGQPSDVDWAVAFLGTGPWGSLAPQLPSHPAQLYEAAATTGVLLLVMGSLAAGWFRRYDGTVFVLAISLWAFARAAVATSWRDPVAVGPLRADQVISLAIGVGGLGLFAALAWRARRNRATRGPGAGRPRRRGPEPEWPDPESRPRF
jgi:phosphatidylglycerol:prolipoprotein diacylglycerol transferase